MTHASTIRTVLDYQLRDALKSRWLLQHTLIYLLVTEGLILAAGAGPRALASLVNVVLLLVPLGSLVFGAIHLHAARSFIVLLLTQPLKRASLFAGIYLGLVVPQSIGLALGIGLPFVWHGGWAASGGEIALLIGLAIALTLVFTAVALLIATLTRERVRCIAIALGVWLVLAVAYDGFVLLAIDALGRYPIEKPLLGIMLLNPVDLARVVLLMVLDAQALMGYTGAVFARFFGTAPGIAVSLFVLAAWVFGPFLLTRRAFERVDTGWSLRSREAQGCTP